MGITTEQRQQVLKAVGEIIGFTPQTTLFESYLDGQIIVTIIGHENGNKAGNSGEERFKDEKGEDCCTSGACVPGCPTETGFLAGEVSRL